MRTQALTNGASRPTAVATKPKELAYVEDVLRVPDLWNDVEACGADYSALLNRKSIHLAGIAATEEKILDKERDLQLELITSDTWDSLSVAAQERAVKQAILKDEALQEMHIRLRALKAELAQMDTDIAACKLNHQTLVTRLNGASDVMNFLASARNARTVAEAALPY